MKKLLHFIMLMLAIVLISNNQKILAQESLTDLGIPENLSYPFIFSLKNAMISDDQGNLWIGIGGFTENLPDTIGGLYRYNDGEWELFNRHNSGLPDNRIRCLAYDRNTLYVGTPGGLSIYNSGEWFLLNAESMGIPSNDVLSVFHGEDSGFYIGTSLGLTVLDEFHSDWMYYDTGNSNISGDRVQALTVDESGTLWVGTSTGLSSLDETTWTNYPSTSGLDIISLANDAHGNIWIGSNGNHGLHLFKENVLYDYKDMGIYSLNENQSVPSISVSPDGLVFASVRSSDVSALLMVKEDISYLYDVRIQQAFISLVDNEIYISGFIPNNLYRFNRASTEMWDNFNYMHVNNIKTTISAAGRLSFDGGLIRDLNFEVPAGEGTHTLFSNNLWIGGMHGDGDQAQLHLAAERFLQIGSDYKKGPLTPDHADFLAHQEKWNKVWHLDKTVVEQHIENWETAGYTMDQQIADWPGNGDSLIGQSARIAPFFDRNNNSFYEPELGDYPIMRGDQAKFFVFNDHLTHTESGGNPLGLEVKGMLYGFNSTEIEALNNTLFMNYQITNKSSNTYRNVYLGTFSDFVLGFSTDNYIGCDTLLNSYYVYNGTAIDGNGSPGTYGELPPAQAITFLNKPLTSFLSNNNSSGGMGEPQTAEQYYNLLQGFWKDGSPIVYGNSGYPQSAEDTIVVKHHYPGDISDPEAWHEFTANYGGPNVPDDKQGIGTVEIGTINPGESICFDLAFVYTRDMENSWPTGSVNKLKQEIADIREFFNTNISNACEDFIMNVEENHIEASDNTLLIYPNPSSTSVTIAYKATTKSAFYEIYNTTGVLLIRGRIQQMETVSLAGYPDGLYFIKVTDGQKHLQSKLVKSK
jgi:hypothetical protein